MFVPHKEHKDYPAWAAEQAKALVEKQEKTGDTPAPTSEPPKDKDDSPWFIDGEPAPENEVEDTVPKSPEGADMTLDEAIAGSEAQEKEHDEIDADQDESRQESEEQLEADRAASNFL